MTTLTNIIEDLRALQGSEVSIFGQPTTLANEINELEIDTIEMLEALQGSEVDVNEWTTYEENEEGEEVEVNIFDGCEDSSDILDRLENFGYISSEYDKADNTYNWSAPLSHHLNWYVFNDLVTGGVFVEIKAHRFGDVRGNYTDAVILHFDSYEAFIMTFEEVDTKYVEVSVSGEVYDVRVSAWSDSFEVCNADGSYICEAYGYDIEEVKECIAEKIAC